MTGSITTTTTTARTIATQRLVPPQPLLARLKRALTGEGAAQIVEFAVSLPLLMLFVVGIFDFSNAVSLKQKLTNAAREAARVAAADSANDLGAPSAGVPASVGDAFQAADNYLLADKVNDCGLSTAAAPAPTGLTWTYTAAGGGCPGAGISVVINRACTSPITVNAGTLNLIGTCITITYTYKWQFNNIASNFGWTGLGTSSLTAKAQALNEN
jgi:Flp pilus assembly protein TadG